MQSSTSLRIVTSGRWVSVCALVVSAVTCAIRPALAWSEEPASKPATIFKDAAKPGSDQTLREAPGSKPATIAKRDPIYDEKADSRVQIATAIKRANRDNKRVLVTFGGNWCGWCYKLHDVFKKNEVIAPVIRDEFELVMIDVGSNQQLLESYGKDNNKHGVPFLTVLDQDGKVLINQNTGDLEKGPEHDIQKVKAFLTAWAPSPRDAEKTFQAGLARAKSENKRVFLHVGAPSCGWCRVLDRFLEEQESIFDRSFVDMKIDIARMSNGAPMAEKLRQGRQGGIPWFAIYDAEGMELVSSDGPQGNIGYPARPDEIGYFIEMLQKAAPRMTPDELARIKTHLEAYAEKHKLR